MTGQRGRRRDTAPVVVRDARPDERAAVAKLTMRAYAEFATVMRPDAWRGLERAVRAALQSDVAERIVAQSAEDELLLGSVMLFPPASAAYGELAAPAAGPELRLLAVTPEARGLGVGQALVEECIRRARASGAAELGLHSSASMQAAIRMYLRFGFERVPERDFQPPGAEVVEGFRLVL